jgi:excisionase family DNA binding protein
MPFIFRKGGSTLNFKNMLTPTEVATIMNVPRSSVYTLIRTDRLPAFKFQNKVFIDRGQLQSFVEKELRPINSSAASKLKIEITDTDVNFEMKSI